MPAADVVPSPPSPSPRLFALFDLPYGAQAALATFVPMYLLRHAGMPIDQTSAIASLLVLPGTFYFLYSPLVDFFMRRRNWYLAALLSTALLSAAAIAWPAGRGIQIIVALAFAGTCSSMLLSAATGGLMSSLLSPEAKSKVGAWVQMGNTGGNALFFGLLMFLAPRLEARSPRFGDLLLAAIAGLTILVPGLAILKIHEPARLVTGETYGSTIRSVGRELRTTFFSLRRLPGILLLVSPIGSGTITTVLSGLTNEYHASADQLSFANGWGGGLLTAVGALCVLGFPTRWNRLVPYAICGILYGSVSLLIGFGALTSTTLIAGMLASNFLQGAAFATYTGVILQTMGADGRCHSSRYTILNSIGSVPVVYMTALLGLAAGHFGPHAVGLFDGAGNIATAAIFFAWFAWVRLRHRSFLDLTPVASAVAMRP